MTSRWPVGVFFDCDGVLLDSNMLKVGIFEECARRFGADPAASRRFALHVRRSFGTSRFRLFDELIRWEVLDEATTQADLVSMYSELLREGYVDAKETPDMSVVVERLALRMPLWVVSGSEQSELRDLFEARGIARNFRSILGSPTPKMDLVGRALTELGLSQEGGATGVVMVGDAEADWAAASAWGLSFVFMRGYSTAVDRMDELAEVHGFPVIDDLRGLSAVLDQMYERAS